MSSKIRTRLPKLALGGPGPRSGINFRKLVNNLPPEFQPSKLDEEVTLSDVNVPVIKRTTPRPSPLPGVVDRKTPVFKESPRTPLVPVKTELDLSGLGKAADAVAPFVSNIANAFRKPPMPSRDIATPYTTLSKVNLDNERADLNRTMNIADRSAERNVDGNTSEAIKAFNRGTRFDRMNTITDRETNANIAIGNDQAKLDMATTNANIAKTNEYNQQLVERKLAQQREQGANIANAGDKVVAIRNEKEKGRVELEKAKVLSSVSMGKGIIARQNKRMKEAGLKNPNRIDGSWREEDFDETKLALGGVLKMRKVR